ncbi:isopentenyl-diphosphate Delta-isomerase [Krasilnikoviella flava]|uniref:Isopentenyl-diphosphate Delta-isomerase n=1 Tax=Krasilnikoviella flava TaxID=526729 RepID=A0A1T5LZM3_9MICO|nr:isopentenyl-diphosphate Delta-isomerase [Krasilnikoviella flava]SKC81039.1 isopentenyl-diphosphate delta-isomerase [Krasilnikoviella flava]
MAAGPGESPGVEDHVILLDDAGAPTGTAPRATVHTRDTPLHLGFSCYLSRPDGRVLLTRRALTKRTWPGVWTNSFCGHPRQGEPLGQAVLRHGRHELGLDVTTDGVPVLPSFRYRAVDAGGVVENEICPVLLASVDRDPVPNPDEVMDWRWVRPDEIASVVVLAPWAVSPWMVAQVPDLRAAGWV